MATATPYRNDGREVVIPGMRVLRRTLAQHMDEGQAPRRLETAIIPVRKSGVVVTPQQFQGNDAPDSSYNLTLARALVRAWEKDGRPKLIVRVPPIVGGTRLLVDEVVNAFKKSGARVFDATGTGDQDKQRVISSLATERPLKYAESGVDVVVGIMRVLEGTDWPHCSTVYCLGFPGSLQMIVQLLGRAARKKAADHPMPHRETASIKFFLPIGDGSVLANLSIEHSRNSLLLCAFLADSEFGGEWLVRKAVQEARGTPGSPGREHDQKKRQEGQVMIAGVIEKLVNEGEVPTVEAVRGRIATDHPRVGATLIEDLLIEALASDPNKRRKVLQRVRSRVRDQANILPGIDEALRSAFDEVVAEFRDETLSEVPLFARLREQSHVLTGCSIGEFHKRLLEIRAYDSIPDLDAIRGWINLYLERQGKFPSQNSVRMKEMPVGWKAVDARCLALGTTLPLLCEEFGHIHLGRRGKLTLKKLIGKIKEFYAEHGRAPTHRDGDIQGWPGESWAGIKACLRNGWRGLPAGEWTLATLAEEHCGHVIEKKRPRLSRTSIAQHMRLYREKHGVLPKRDSGPVEGRPGEFWKAWDAAGNSGCRGLKKGDTLADIKWQFFGWRRRKSAKNVAVITRSRDAR